jgi:hypothetical protein
MRLDMPNVTRLIDAHGGMERLQQRPIRVESPPFMRLVIEHVGEGPRGLPAVSVAHYYEQNGDLMRDPEIVFEVGPDGWDPVSYQQDNLSIYQEAVYVARGKVCIQSHLVADLKFFARKWDRNIGMQGFLKGGGPCSSP